MRKIILLIIFSISLFKANSQFYQGYQLTFGKNRIQYRNFQWRYYRYSKFDIYYYKGSRTLAYFLEKTITETLKEYERLFDLKLSNRLLFIVYNNLTDFKQTNIGLFTGNVNVQLPATTQIIDNKIIVYYQGNILKLKIQLREALAEIFIRQVLYGSAFSRRYSSSTVINLPKWFTEGLASYIAEPNNLDVDNSLRDIFLHSKKLKFNRIHTKDAKILGHSLWAYIAKVYGKDVILNIVYFSRIYKNLSNAFYYVIGVKLKEINKQWFEYYKNYYTSEYSYLQSFDSLLVLNGQRRNRYYAQIKFNPRKNLFAYIENKQGHYKIIIYNPETKKKRVIYKAGHRLEEIVDYTYPLIEWRPDGQVLLFITENKGVAFINEYDLETRNITRTSIPQVSKIFGISYSDNGRFLAISAMQGDFVDLFVYNSITGAMQKITNDPYEDLYPQFIDKGRKIVFSSNRDDNLFLNRISRVEQADSLSRTYDLYVYDFRRRSRRLKRLTNTPYSNEIQAFGKRQGEYVFLSDSSGIINRYTLSYDSIIDYVDTVVHYKFFSTMYPITNLPSSILDYDIDIRTNKIAETKLWSGINLFSTYKQKYNREPVKLTLWRRELIKKWKSQDKIINSAYDTHLKKQKIIDSLISYFSHYIPKVRDTFVNINNYTFEIERDSMLLLYYLYKKELQRKRNLSKKWGKIWIYTPTFYITRTSYSFDYSQLVQTYQPFNGGPFVFSSQLNLFSVVVANELFEDYRLLGGFRLGGDFRSTEYLFSFEDLHKRLDKQIIYHRISYFSQPSFQGYDYVMTKDITQELIFRFTYPFSQVSSLRASVLGRYDRSIFLYTDLASMEREAIYKFYAGEKLEYVYDNTFNLAPNLYDGIRYKVFIESFQQIKGNEYWLVVGGLDFRFYKEIWRNMIFAWRLAASANTGSGKLVYYLGGVDYWQVISLNPLEQGDKNFHRDVNINYSNNYIFQAVATPMRGYKQNIRNGTNFILTNAELRLPLVKMLLNQPIISSFWSNFQLVVFFDMGSAWCGISPLDDCNTYNIYNMYNPPVSVIVDLERPPVLLGYGFGLRTKILGYFTRFDFSWGYEGGKVHPMQFYFSLSYDF